MNGIEFCLRVRVDAAAGFGCDVGPDQVVIGAGQRIQVDEGVAHDTRAGVGMAQW